MRGISPWRQTAPGLLAALAPITLVRADNSFRPALDGTLSGHAAMRRLEISIIANGTGSETRLSGRMGPAGQTPPASDAFTPAQSITFSDGSMLTRNP